MKAKDKSKYEVPCSISHRYSIHLKDAMKFGRRKGLVSGGGMGVVMFIIFLVYCVIFWYGCKLVREDDHYTAGKMLIVSTNMWCIIQHG